MGQEENEAGVGKEYRSDFFLPSVFFSDGRFKTNMLLSKNKVHRFALDVQTCSDAD